MLVEVGELNHSKGPPKRGMNEKGQNPENEEERDPVGRQRVRPLS